MWSRSFLTIFRQYCHFMEFPSLGSLSYRNRGEEAKREGFFFPFRKQLTASVCHNGQSRGGRFTGRVPRGSRSSRSAVHRGFWGRAHHTRAAELLQLQRSDTRWCCLVFFEHVRYSEIWVRIKGEVEIYALYSSVASMAWIWHFVMLSMCL